MKIIDFCKCIISYFFSLFVRKKYKDVWLISERGDDARDNGFFFFQYLRKEHPEIKCYYRIKKSSPDYKKVKELGDVVESDSLLNGVLYYSCKNVISTHSNFGCPNWKVINYFDRKKILKPRGKKIFLQHGIIKDMLDGLMYPTFRTDLFICGAQPEYNYVKENFNHKDGVVVYTGLARYDKLYLGKDEFKNKKQVLLMPTWRTSLSRIEEKEFLKSDYYNKYQQLLLSEELTNLLEKYGYELIFYPHYEIQKWIHNFKSKYDNVKIADMVHYDVQQLLINSSILITDYSSVFFDFAFLRKPIIFYQFDYMQFRESHYKKGYFKYEDGFGPIVDNVEDIVKYIEKYISHGMEQQYMNKADMYFKYFDCKNCDRIYECISKL